MIRTIYRPVGISKGLFFDRPFNLLIFFTQVQHAYAAGVRGVPANAY
jgi:hypothetical protein